MMIRFLVAASAVVLAHAAISTPVHAQTPAPAVQAAYVPPPVEAYGAAADLTNVIISPDGTKLAYATRTKIVVQSMDGKPLHAIETAGTKLRGIQFLGPNHLIINSSTFTTLPLPGASAAEYFQAQSLNLATGKVVYLMTRTPGTTNIITGGVRALERDGRWYALTESVEFTGGGQRHLYRVDLDTGEGVIHERGGAQAREWLLDGNGAAVARSEYGNDTKRWRMLIRQPNGLWNEVLNVPSPVDWPDMVSLNRDGTGIIVSFVENQHGTWKEVAIADGKLGEFAGPKSDFLAGPITDPVTRRLIGYAYLRDYSEYEFIDAADQRAWRSVVSAFKGKRVRLQSWTTDRRKIVAHVEGPGDSGTYYLVDLGAKSAQVIGEERPQIRPEHVGTVKRIDYKAQDGLNIPAYLTLPPGRENAQGLPLVVLPHGGPASRDEMGFDSWAQLLASRGYAVLQPQFRGSTGFGPEHLAAGYGQWGKKMQTDLSDGVRYLVAQGIVDAKRVCIFGWSYGGYAAMAGPTLDPGVYRCAVAGAGVADLERMIDWVNNESGRKDNPATRYWNRNMGDRSLWPAASPARHVDKLNVPMLLIHGRDDTVVPYQQSAIFRDAARKVGREIRIVELKGEDHWLSSADTRTEMFKAMLEFMLEHNPPS